ncbi:unnamed protein product, partial [marine sediment metagenome]
MARLSDYEAIVGKGIIDDLRRLGEKAKGRTVQNINSTAVGGGVAFSLSISNTFSDSGSSTALFPART